jgi:bis(5'-nucleosyl)-tetraphosphatase (symmetrical)
MATYVVGDVQGCFTALQQLLQQVGFSPATDRLWLVGDMVNRGPDSLAVLRWVRDLGERATVVLGNHDLHLLAVHAGAVQRARGDTLDAVLAAPDADELLDWLRCRPLLHVEDGVVMVHAGLLPAWDVATAQRLAAEVEGVLRGPGYLAFLGQMYGNQPVQWQESLQGVARWRLIVNTFTRMRMVTQDGALDLRFKGERTEAPPELLPWFAHPQRRWRGAEIVCGHWSALGLYQHEGVHALDTGCLWGGNLTALRLEDRAVFSLPCSITQAPDW